MAGLKELRNRIEAIKSTEKITSAMKMVAASRLRKAQDLLAKSEPYRHNLYTAVGRILYSKRRRALEQEAAVVMPPLCMPHEKEENYLLVVLSSDRGLCGSYNAAIARTAMKRIEELLADGKQVRLICLGQRGYNALRRTYADIIVGHQESAAAKGVDYEEAVELGDKLRTMFAGNEIDVCEVVYSRFESAIRRQNVSRRLLPFAADRLEEELPSDMDGDAYYESEPDEETLLQALLPMAFNEMIFDIMINSQASEQGARMTSMDNATRNAGDMISRLTLRYNRIRQTAITTELVEIIAGAEAI